MINAARALSASSIRTRPAPPPFAALSSASGLPAEFTSKKFCAATNEGARTWAPPSHWNNAYPFVRLHQPSAYYGVNSRKLGSDAIDATGWNKGLYELAT